MLEIIGDEVPIIVDHGYKNRIYIYEKASVVAREPKDTSSHETLVKEAQILKEIESTHLSIQHPKLICLQESPLVMFCKYIDGTVYKSEEIASWNHETKDRLAAILAIFIVELGNSRLNNCLEPSNLIMDFEHDINHDDSSSNDYVMIAKAKLELLKQRADNLRPVPVHGDIHGANLVFDDKLELVGILDFAELKLGSIYEELRKIAIMDDYLLKKTVEQYNTLTGSNIELTQIMNWAIVHELCVLIKNANNTNYPSLPRARANLKNWKIL